MIPTGLKWFAFFAGRIAVPYGPLAMSWANEICGGDAEERALVLGIMNSMGYAFNAWLPIKFSYTTSTTTKLFTCCKIANTQKQFQ